MDGLPAAAGLLAPMGARPLSRLHDATRGTERRPARFALRRVDAVQFDGDDEAKENDILAAIVAVLLAGAITFVVWAVFGQG